MAHVRFNASDRSYTALIKKDIHRMVSNAGLEVKRVDEVDIIVAEITSNLLKYAKEGELLALIGEETGNKYLELIAIDKGPGMADPARMLEDGISTSGTLGQGLGAIKRLADTCEIYSLKGWGTILLARIYQKPPPYKKPPKFTFRGLVVAKPGETVSGDGWQLQQDHLRIRVMVADGLGHGPEAQKAVQTAGQAFLQSDAWTPAEIIRQLHLDVKRTRGLVATILTLDLQSKAVQVCGVGNISCKVYGGAQSKGLISYNGIIGMNIPGTMKDHQFFVAEGQQYIILCSDGIRSQWEIIRYPGILKYDPSVLAAAIYKDFARQTDDMSVVVGKLN
ncbi:ATP-binding protein [Paraflavitalea pollutisoli]|uniref:ATP-binding protein n=1 Tax=Paraflavitalea pollutisoli TaxID=3034143 RepID=UPI0023ED1E16|nr:ATP-binding protein [Paraflavitalea sp. H1-2-19X]